MKKPPRKAETKRSVSFGLGSGSNGADLPGIRWIELQNTGLGWLIRQESTFAPADSRRRWMGSIAMNGAGEIGLVAQVLTNLKLSGLCTGPRARSRPDLALSFAAVQPLS